MSTQMNCVFWKNKAGTILSVTVALPSEKKNPDGPLTGVMVIVKGIKTLSHYH
jgi:hypothetical protein